MPGRHSKEGIRTALLRGSPASLRLVNYRTGH